jgi:hypothetical protein
LRRTRADSDEEAPEAGSEVEASLDLFDLVGRARKPSGAIEGIVIGRLVGFDRSSRALVTFPEGDRGEPKPARSTVALGPSDVGGEVALAFEGGSAAAPIVIGRIHGRQVEEAAAPKIRVGRDWIDLSADREVTIRCGKASITLSRDGTVVVRGTRLLSRASGVNRIRGGSVQIN